MKGSSDKPSGNLIAWCKVIGLNPVEQDADYIVCNIMVSFLDAQENNFPVVVFPPIGAENLDHLKELCNIRTDYDIVQIPDFEIPQGTKEGKYIEERLDDLNQIVVEYVDTCRDSFQLNEDFLSGFEVERLAPKKEILSDEEKTLDRLAQSISSPDDSKGELPNVLNYIQKTYPIYDIQNLKKVLKKENSDLAKLYIQKFRAIFKEEYEEAAVLQNKIRQLDPMV